jgi:hypothetical protein
MPLPEPLPGLVIGFDFLFREEAAAGQENASRPHPCAIILVTTEGPRRRVRVLAISHAPPSASQARHYLQLTPAECRQMGLDSGNHWINLRDINSFDWPGYDLRPIAPGGGYVFGRMSRQGFARLVTALKASAGRKTISRD